ncbi:hypothetical protein ES705_20344 [subsurface metagenome]
MHSSLHISHSIPQTPNEIQQSSIKITILQTTKGYPQHIGESQQNQPPQRVATGRFDVGPQKGKIKHLSKQDAIDHAIKTLRETKEPEHRRLLSLLLTDSIQKMPRRGNITYYHFWVWG